MDDTFDRFLSEASKAAPDYSPYDEKFLSEFLKLGPLHYFIPTSLGGRFKGSLTCMQLLDMISYHSLPLGLTLGITGSLFLRPMAKLASAELQAAVLPRFLGTSELGGMMITEPTGGTDIFGLRSTLSSGGGRVTLNGRKCWGGLTGRAEHWLVAARVKKGDKLTRRVAMIYVPLATEGIAVEDYFDALGLQPIPYGTTRYSDVSLPESNVVTPMGRSALRDIYDTLFRSRMGISAIAAGQCRRLADEVEKRAASRVVFGRSIAEYDQVQFRLSGLRGMQQINHALWRFAGAWSDRHDDVSGDHVLANASKVVATEGLSASADSAVQVFASAAYKRNHVAGRAFVDSRPFQIFEGSNDVLNENTFDVLVGRYGSVDREALAEELARYGLALSDDVPASVRDVLACRGELPQRRKVQYGRIVSWLVVQSILERQGGADGLAVKDGLRLARQHMAARAAELPYLE